MIKFDPNGASLMLSNDQLATVAKLAGTEDARVIDLHSGTSDIEVYVGDYYHEPYRHRVDWAGVVLMTEHDPNDDGDWCGAWDEESAA